MDELTVSQLLERIGDDQKKPEDERRLEETFVEMGLEAVHENRTVSPFVLEEGVSLLPFEAVPVPAAVWCRVANVKTWELGLTRDVTDFLEERGIYDLGSLLLHAEEEITVDMSAEQKEDLLFCLGLQKLRLPQRLEIEAAKEDDFWVELPDMGRESRGPLRVATYQLPLLDGRIVASLSGTPERFFQHSGLYGLGDVLLQSADQLREAWIDYFLKETAEGTSFRHAADGAVRGMLARTADPYHTRLLEWIQAAGLKLTS